MTTSKESMHSMLRHEELPHLVALAMTLNIMKEEIHVNNGELWVSKQQLPASSLTVEETKKTVLAFGEQLKSLSYLDHTSVRRGDFPITDSLMDDAFKILRNELADMTAFQEATASSVPSSRGTAAASASVAAAAKEKKNSRKRCYSHVTNDRTVPKIAKGATWARLASPPNRSESAAAAASAAGRVTKKKVYPDRCRSSDQIDAISTSSGSGLFKWQIDKMVDWMKQNDYNPSPGWEAIDNLVEATRMKPSQIMTWASEIGSVVSNLLNNNHDQQPSATIKEDKESVPELAEDDTTCNGVSEDGTEARAIAKPHSVLGDCSEDEIDFDSLEVLLLESGFEFGASNLCDNLQTHEQDGQESSVAFGSLTNDELFEGFCLNLDCENVIEENLHRPPKRARSDSFDGLLF